MSAPLILEPMIRFDQVGLSLAVLVLGAACIGLLIALPAVAAANRRLGRAGAAPKLPRELEETKGRFAAVKDAAKQEIEHQAREIADLKATNAELRGRAADIARKAMELVNAHEEPTEAQAQILRIGTARR